MNVFKFGGASIKDAAAVKRVAQILKMIAQDDTIVVVSAMGKITNALEKLVDAVFYKKGNPDTILEEIKHFHMKIIKDLFPSSQHPIYNEIANTFVELDWSLEDETTSNYNYEYDKIVCMGEILSSKIINAYINEAGIVSTWWDIRGLIQTDNTYREGKVNWELTQELVNKELLPFFSQTGKNIIVTQGFIGGTSENFTTTLGREGSDYSAAIIAFATNATNVTIWKDVPGVLNADPKWFDKTTKLDQLSYQDAIELAYYGASIIHPKTIKPLQNRNIHLYVKSFLKPEDTGTVICDRPSSPAIPCFIFKINQVLLSISPKDFSFIAEENLASIFNLFAEKQIKINVMQNSAISFSVSIDNDPSKVLPLIEVLKNDFRVLYNENVELITIRYYDQPTLDRVLIDKAVLLEVKTRNTVQLIVKSK